MTVGSLLALLVPALAAYLVLRRLWGGSRARLGRALAAATAPGLGIGFASCVYFLLLLLTRNHHSAVRLDAGFWILSTVGLLAYDVIAPGASRQRANAEDDAAARASWGPALVVTVAGLLALSALAAASFWLHWTLNPHGEWDAWAIWNLRARSLLTGADWTAPFSAAIGWSHPDYPLLVPLTVARSWAYSGRESTVVPAVIALIFSMSSIAVVVISVGRLRGWTVGLLSGMALLIARTYVFQSSCQCADQPIGFFILVAIVFLTMSQGEIDPRPFLVTGGAAAGLAAWTKNEGALLLVLIFLVASVLARRGRALLSLTAGAAVPVLVLAIFKAGLSPSNYLFDQQTIGEIAGKIFATGRSAIVIDQFVRRIPAWGEVPGGALAGLGLAVALTASPDRRSAGRAAFALMLVCAMFIGYGLVYLITPAPLEWQIATSFDRLLTQLWPTTVWAAFQLSSSGPSREAGSSRRVT